VLALALTRCVLVLGLIGVGLPVGAGVAAAHGDGLGPEAHVPRVLAVDPPVPGLAVAVIEAGARLRLDNQTGQTVDVLPLDAAARATEPVVAPGATARWHDPRVAAAAADPVPPGASRPWAVPLRIGDQLVTVHGEQVWPPAPSSLPWWSAMVVVAVVMALLGIRAATRPRWSPVLAGSTLLIVAAHLVHVVGSALIVEDQALLPIVLGAAGPAVLAWVLALVGVGLTLARRAYGPLLCTLAGGLLALVSAFGANNFGSPVLPFAGPPDLDRAAVALTVGGGVGLFMAGLAVVSALTADDARPTRL
jgi:hypothetical protein